MIEGKVAYLLVALFDHVASIKNHFESGKVRENWVREPDGWDGIELGTLCSSRTARLRRGQWTDQWVDLEIPADKESDHDNQSREERRLQKGFVWHGATK